MINIKELSVGNWVKFPHGIDKIVDLPYVEGKGMCASFAASATLFPVSVEELEPIPITPEILKKNGFGNDFYVDEAVADYHFVRLEGYSLHIKELQQGGDDALVTYCNGSVNIATELNGEINKEILYIHQLQNALTLCGINKEIKL